MPPLASTGRGGLGNRVEPEGGVLPPGDLSVLKDFPRPAEVDHDRAVGHEEGDRNRSRGQAESAARPAARFRALFGACENGRRYGREDSQRGAFLEELPSFMPLLLRHGLDLARSCRLYRRYASRQESFAAYARSLLRPSPRWRWERSWSLTPLTRTCEGCIPGSLGSAKPGEEHRAGAGHGGQQQSARGESVGIGGGDGRPEAGRSGSARASLGQ
jgi:hypothetical protein